MRCIIKASEQTIIEENAMKKKPNTSIMHQKHTFPVEGSLIKAILVTN